MVETEVAVVREGEKRRGQKESGEKEPRWGKAEEYEEEEKTMVQSGESEFRFDRKFDGR